MLHVPGSHVHINITFYYVNVTFYVVGMCVAGTSTTTWRKVYALETSETGSLQAISYIFINGGFTVIGGYKYCGINNRPVITENKLVTKAVIIEKIILTCRLIIEKFISTLFPFNLLNKNLLEQTHELFLELEILKFDISLLKIIYVACKGGRGRIMGRLLQWILYFNQAL